VVLSCDEFLLDCHSISRVLKDSKEIGASSQGSGAQSPVMGDSAYLAVPPIDFSNQKVCVRLTHNASLVEEGCWKSRWEFKYGLRERCDWYSSGAHHADEVKLLGRRPASRGVKRDDDLAR
jgi:hypothetical protein